MSAAVSGKRIAKVKKEVWPRDMRAGLHVSRTSLLLFCKVSAFTVLPVTCPSTTEASPTSTDGGDSSRLRFVIEFSTSSPSSPSILTIRLSSFRFFASAICRSRLDSFFFSTSVIRATAVAMVDIGTDTGSCVRKRVSNIVISAKPRACRVWQVFWTCSMHGEKQHMREI